MGRETIHDPLFGQTLTFVATGRGTGGELLAAELRLTPGGRVPRHAHLRQEERIEVVEGEVTVRSGGREHHVGPGDAFDVPRRRMHEVRNAGDGEARFRLEVRPARRMETAMRALFGLTRAVARVTGRRG